MMAQRWCSGGAGGVSCWRCVVLAGCRAGGVSFDDFCLEYDEGVRVEKHASNGEEGSMSTYNTITAFEEKNAVVVL